jgi:HEAT repeat protein
MEIYDELISLLSTMRRPGRTVRSLARELARGDIGLVCQFLERAIKGLDDNLRGEALHLLAQVSPPRAADASTGLLADADPTIRWVACGVIEDVGDVSDEATILRLLDRESDPEVRFAAVSALRRVGTPACLPRLGEIAKTDRSTDFEGRPMSELVPKVVTAIKNRTPMV